MSESDSDSRRHWTVLWHDGRMSLVGGLNEMGAMQAIRDAGEDPSKCLLREYQDDFCVTFKPIFRDVMKSKCVK